MFDQYRDKLDHDRESNIRSEGFQEEELKKQFKSTIDDIKEKYEFAI
jgi:hypothetical protein